MPDGPKLRCPALQPPFSVVLVAPEIPPNTGSVARTCVATCSPLHLIEPLGFDLDDRSLKRAGIDYWHLLTLHVHPSFDAYLQANPAARLHLFTGSASRSFLDVAFQPGDALVFGRESVGLDAALLARYPERCVAIPTSGGVRSLNLSNAVSVALYEALRQADALHPTRLA